MTDFHHRNAVCSALLSNKHPIFKRFSEWSALRVCEECLWMVLSVERDYSAGLTSQVISATNLAPDGLRPDRNAGLVLILPLQLAGAWHGGIRHGRAGLWRPWLSFHVSDEIAAGCEYGCVSQQMHINAYISVRSWCSHISICCASEMITSHFISLAQTQHWNQLFTLEITLQSGWH